jgi:hypothetical protein
MQEIKTTWIGPNPFGIESHKKIEAKIADGKVIVDAASHVREYMKVHKTKRGCWPSLYEYFVRGKTLEMVCSKNDVRHIARNAREWVLRHGLRIQVVQIKQSIDGRGRVVLKG